MDASSMITYLPDWNAEHLHRQVSNVVVVGYPNATAGPLHWVIYLSIGPELSVVLNMVPGFGADFMTGMIMIESRDHLFSPDSEAVHTIPTVRDITVQDVIDLLRRLGRDKYKFDETGSGCRYWCSTVVGDFEADGGIASGSREALEQYIATCVAADPVKFPTPTRMGKFY